nr:EAL domain-containing protein [uncultured Desulfuromonas sp.]
MKLSPSRSVFMLVWLLIATAVVAVVALMGLGYDLVTDLSVERAEVHRELIDKRATVERLQTLLAEIRSESLKLFYEQDQPNRHDEAVHRYSRVLLPFITSFDTPDNESLERCQSALEDLNRFTDRADQWASRYHEVYHECLDGGGLIRIRRLLRQLHAISDILQGRQRLDEAVLIRRWRQKESGSVEQIAQQLIDKRQERWFPLLREIRSEVDSLAQQVEQLAGSTRRDQLMDIRDNMLKSGLERLKRNLVILVEDKVLEDATSLDFLETLQVELFGSDYRIDPGHQTVIVTGGLYALHEERIKLLRERMVLEKSLQESYAGLESLNVALAQLTQSRLDALGKQAEQWLEHALATIRGGSVIVLTVFIFIGTLISLLVRRQVRQVFLLQRDKESILNAAGDGIVGVDKDGRATFINPAAARMLGYDADDLLHRHVVEAIPVILAEGENVMEQDHPFYRTMRLKEGACTRSELEFLRRRDGTIFSVEYVASPLIDPVGRHEGVVFIFKDLTWQQQAEKRLEEKKQLLDYMSNHDSLTGLPNRRLFKDRLYHAIERARRTEQEISVLFIDLDRFKKINDSLGHEMGDSLLMAVANRLKGYLRRSDTLARLGGDEFVVIAEESTHSHFAAVLARNLLKELSTVFEVETHRLFVTASIGISRYPHDAQDVNGLMSSADAAMYHAKSRGRNDFQFYAPEMNGRAQEFLEMETLLRDALELGQFEVFYQPQFDMRDRSLVGAEALIRWNHPQLGLVSPGDFIPLAEETGLIVPIGKWVLTEACQQNRRWIDDGLNPLRIAVNLSIAQFRTNLSTTLEQVLAQSRIPSELLELEITESMLMEDDQKTIVLLNELKAKGVHISIDDFGTGYSSLSYLRKLPVDKLKIDRSFIADVVHNESDAAIISSIIALGQNMDLAVLAEGVENEDQRDFLVNQQCYIAQGFLYAKPMTASDLTELLKKSQF